MQLTPEQQKIIQHSTGHARVSAVAGSGKTTAMVARVVHLLQQGAAANTILILMFNRSARDAFEARLRRSLQGSALRTPDVRTFHSLGLRLVNSFMNKNHLPRFNLLTRDYQMENLASQAVKQYANEVGGDDQWWSKENMEDFLLFIDLVKANIDAPLKIFDCSGFEEPFSYFVPAYTMFESMRTAARVRFYADLIHEPVLAMRRDKELAAWVGSHVDHIIVDEYQDINEVQQQLLLYIAADRAEVMVVGDVDQCIYEWRGAKPEYIISRFGRDFSNPTTYTLSYTFRYGHRLALAANHLIRNNKYRDRKLCLARSENPDTRIHWLEDNVPHPVVKIIKQLRENGGTLSNAAVLVRIYAQSVLVELALLEHGIPYRLVGHDTVFSCVEIKALLGYLLLCQGSLINIDENSNRETRRAVITAMLTNPHLWLKKEAINSLAEDILSGKKTAPDLIRHYAAQVDATYPATRMKGLAQTWQMIAKTPATTPAAAVLTKVVHETELFDHYLYASRPDTAANKIKTCNSFIRFARRSGLNVNGFLDEIRNLAASGATDDTESLLITSIHRAKGLEWPTVILPGLEDGVVPFRREEDTCLEGEDDNDDIEDERRLFYVAMTRACEQLFLIHPSDTRLKRRREQGDCCRPDSTEEGAFPASCFVYEANLEFSDRLGAGIGSPDTVSGPLTAVDISIGQQYLKLVKARIQLKRVAKKAGRARRSGKKENFGKKDILTINDLTLGLMVQHSAYGSGAVTRIVRSRGVVDVMFEEHGSKRLVVSVARLRE